MMETKKVELGNADYEVVGQFCYLGDKLKASRGAEACRICKIRLKKV